ncbi:GGDEF domain-containing protein [Trinickia caryophylli]|uniref:diguanylate cyclase n=1 Tax=Trinickia caryophylli TaxID=28094 RepID=A0A1X7FTS2_TRICW|nr:GGDEF domain-containing protein [Trinickia caryophylli]PMS11957.1 GGDEF domain-containing protein [Trinickia caryophylli]TRX13963.1 GGDEF domain-containing protein [Trinickia caryophylli]WQE15560.1 GGDEF domain-containing protein [Trinickia caryophylli]SMF57919.1 diguanylate cyclase (GGDEF) domain-containing protein [Trinickia caryophylli]GLU33688.1 GGDEF domain-containing protein [Trinickia caryophylli]
MTGASVALATTGLMSLIMLALLGSLLRSGIPGVHEWLAANAAMVASLPLILLRGAIPDFFSIVVANGLVALAGVTFHAGCARFLKRPVSWVGRAAVVAAACAAMAYWRYTADSIPMRVLAMSVFTSGICVAIALTVWRHRAPGRGAYPYRLTASMALFFAVSQMIRGAYFMTLVSASSPLMFATTGNVILLSIGAAVMPVLSMCAMMMVHAALLSEARDAADHDFLTGALSRKGFEAYVLARLAEAERSRAPLSLVLVDLDRFKAVNDTFGHAGGDEVLRAFVTLAQAHLRAGDALGRMGGEEFGVLLPRTDLIEAREIAERLRCEVHRAPVATESGICRYSISAGAARWSPGLSFDHLARHADLALYEAKVSGRDRVCAYEPASALERESAGSCSLSTGTSA